MSRATLLRALPAYPTDGAAALRVFQGDSLMWNSQIKTGDDDGPEEAHPQSSLIIEGGNFEVDTTLKRTLRIPVGFATRREFASNVKRIVANPPWVRMSNIQVTGRKAEFESLATRLGLWGQGKANTGFDIAALFVSQCRKNYLRSDAHSDKAPPAAGWVLPWAATRGKNWESARRDQRGSTTEIWDLSKVKEQPFTGSESCVWIQTAPNKQGIEPPTQCSNRGPRWFRMAWSSWQIARPALGPCGTLRPRVLVMGRGRAREL